MNTYLISFFPDNAPWIQLDIQAKSVSNALKLAIKELEGRNIYDFKIGSITKYNIRKDVEHIMRVNNG